MSDPTALIAGAIFAATYVVVAVGKLPGWRIDRAGAALLGAGLMVACGGLLLLAGLFIVVAGLEKSVLMPDVAARVGDLQLQRLPVLAAATAVLSNVVSNVPAALVLKPFVAPLPDPTRAWLCVASASTLAGNFTLVGSVANLIVVQRARARGVQIGFRTYFRLGAPLTVLTILVALLWLGKG